MDQILCFFHKIYKRIRPPKRLYKHGTVGLKYFDDRTKKEKVFDYIDEFFFKWEQERRYKKAYRKQVWHSYFDYGLGKMVTSSEEIRKKEKQGYVYMTDAELDRESARRQRMNKEERRARTQKAMEEGFAKIRSGNSNYYQQFLKKYQK